MGRGTHTGAGSRAYQYAAHAHATREPNTGTDGATVRDTGATREAQSPSQGKTGASREERNNACSRYIHVAWFRIQGDHVDVGHPQRPGPGGRGRERERSLAHSIVVIVTASDWAATYQRSSMPRRAARRRQVDPEEHRDGLRAGYYSTEAFLKIQKD